MTLTLTSFASLRKLPTTRAWSCMCYPPAFVIEHTFGRVHALAPTPDEMVRLKLHGHNRTIGERLYRERLQRILAEDPLLGWTWPTQRRVEIGHGDALVCTCSPSKACHLMLLAPLLTAVGVDVVLYPLAPPPSAQLSLL